MSNKITTISRRTEVANRNRFLVPKKAKIFTQTSFDNSTPGIVGLSIFVEAENDGEAYNVGKTKAVSIEKLPRIRENLDKFGAEFTKSAMQNTSESSFKSMLSGILDNLLSSSDSKEQEED